MVEATLSEKLELTADRRAALIEAPPGYRKRLAPPSGAKVSESLEGSFDWVQIFVKNRADLEEWFPKVERALDPAGLLWIAYPKGTSSLATDLTRDEGWDIVRRAELKWLRLISLDGTWSAFALRRYRRGEARQTFR